MFVTADTDMKSEMEDITETAAITIMTVADIFLKDIDCKHLTRPPGLES